mmetsp:Transcript_100306/g.284154  ORF Transcript_100306/g.284154 Transcript_100306/m.284154 type:complete len:277 (-) Transcript_100306:37-867(-)
MFGNTCLVSVISLSIWSADSLGLLDHDGVSFQCGSMDPKHACENGAVHIVGKVKDAPACWALCNNVSVQEGYCCHHVRAEAEELGTCRVHTGSFVRTATAGAAESAATCVSVPATTESTTNAAEAVRAPYRIHCDRMKKAVKCKAGAAVITLGHFIMTPNACRTTCQLMSYQKDGCCHFFQNELGSVCQLHLEGFKFEFLGDNSDFAAQCVKVLTGPENRPDVSDLLTTLTRTTTVVANAQFAPTRDAPVNTMPTTSAPKHEHNARKHRRRWPRRK